MADAHLELQRPAINSETPAESSTTLAESVSPVHDDEEASVVMISSLGHFLCHLGELIFPSVMVAVMTQLVLEKNQITWLPFLGYMLMGVGALPVGIWADAWNPRKILFVYFVLSAAGGLAVAVATNVWSLFLALTLFGLALSIYHPVGLAMISLGVRGRGRALGINGVAGSLGLALSPLLAAAALALGSWRYAYLAFAVLSAVCAMAFYFSKHGVRRANVRARSVSEDNTGEKSPPSSFNPIRSFVPLALLMIVMTLGGLNYRSLVTALPPFLLGDRTAEQAHAAASATAALTAPTGALFVAATHSSNVHMPSSSSTARAGWLTFIILLAGGIGQMLGGWLADRYGARRVYAFLVMMLIPLSLAIAISGGTIVGVLFACCMAIGMFGQQPVENSLLADYTSKARRSRSYALKFVMTFGIGSFGAILVGQIWQTTNSLNAVFYTLAASGIIMMLLLALFHALADHAIPHSEAP